MIARLATAACLLLLAGLSSCTKVPIIDVNAGFKLADASWFAEEETLFLFYEVNAEQGIGDPSIIEVRYVTDTERVDWTPVSDLIPVHQHLPGRLRAEQPVRQRQCVGHGHAPGRAAAAPLPQGR